MKKGGEMVKKILLSVIIIFLTSIIATAGEKYKWLSSISDEVCMQAAEMGGAKGKRDRQIGIKDNNKLWFAQKMCEDGGCSIGMKAELATCYELGYDTGYYHRY